MRNMVNIHQKSFQTQRKRNQASAERDSHSKCNKNHMNYKAEVFSKNIKLMLADAKMATCSQEGWLGGCRPLSSFSVVSIHPKLTVWLRYGAQIPHIILCAVIRIPSLSLIITFGKRGKGATCSVWHQLPAQKKKYRYGRHYVEGLVVEFLWMEPYEIEFS